MARSGSERIGAREQVFLVVRIEIVAEESWVSLKVLEHVAVAAAAEACKPILDVSGITGLRHLAVVDDVEAHLQLPVDDELDGARHLALESGRVERQPILAREHELLELLRARQAADVGR
jgi:hypothetical protein